MSVGGVPDPDPLADVLIGGREQVPIVVSEYDDAWPRRYEHLRERVVAALGPVALRVEHIGSTSVPGRAKPLQGGVHLVLLAAFLFLTVAP